MELTTLKKRSCARVPTQISEIALGTVKLGRNVNVKNKCGDNLPLPGPQQIHELLDTAESLGINVLDTAPAYGSSEERLGAVLKERRHKFLISSKVGEEFDGMTSRYDFTPAHVVASVERSLTRLNIGQLDFLFLHCPREDLAVVSDSKLIGTLQKLKSDGKVRFIGASTATIPGGFAATNWADVLMVAYNSGYTEQECVLAKAKEVGAGIFVKKALMQGFAGPDERAQSIRLSLQAPAVLSLVVGTVNPEHLRENCQTICQR